MSNVAVWRERYPHVFAANAPRIVREAAPLLGTLEGPGSRDNPTILAWAKEVGGSVGEMYKADSIPWCGLFAAVIAKRATWDPPKSPLWALSWATFGRWVGDAKTIQRPALGDILVFTRKGGGHVGIYVGEDDGAFHVLGGNQSDAVTITRIAKSRFYTARRPIWRNAQPASVKSYTMTSKGALSVNEA